jgi:hypothetical protein
MHKKYDLRPRKESCWERQSVQSKMSPPNHPKDKSKEVLDTTKVNDVLEPLKGEKEPKEADNMFPHLTLNMNYQISRFLCLY